MDERLQVVKRFAFVALILGAVVVYLFIPPAQRPAFLERLEYVAYDQRMQLSVSSTTVDSEIVVIDIDQSSQDQKGQWPWPRHLTAEMLTLLLTHYQVAGVGLDVYFPDETGCSSDLDSELSEVLQEYADNIVMALKLTDKPQAIRKKRGDVTGEGVSLVGIDGLPPAAQYLGHGVDFSGNLARFVTPQSAIGHIIPVIDTDAKVRQLLPVYQFAGQYFDALSLSMWRQILGADSLQLDTSLDHWWDSPKLRLMLGGQPVGQLHIPVNEFGEVLIPFHSRVESVSAADVLDKTIDAESLKGKFVLMGSSAKAQGDDLVATPLKPELPGVEIHAVMLGAMLAQMDDGAAPRFKTQPLYEKYFQVALMCVVLLVLLVAHQFGVRAMLVTGPLLLGAWIVSNYWLWAVQNIALVLLPLMALILLLLMYLVISDLLDINARHRHIRRMFGYYLPEPVVQRLAIERQGSDWLKPERREMTILFADIQGFTAMAEMLPPEVVANITKQLFTNLTGVIHEHQGTVDKYMGDAVMAFWGAPLLDDQHALHAAKAALAMQAVVSQLNTAVFSQQNINIHLGIGINTGVVVVGNLGSEQRHAYTVMGGAVNAASAIQQLTRHYPYDILAGEETASQLPASIQVDLGSAETRKLPHKLRVFAITDAC